MPLSFGTTKITRNSRLSQMCLVRVRHQTQFTNAHLHVPTQKEKRKKAGLCFHEVESRDSSSSSKTTFSEWLISLNRAAVDRIKRDRYPEVFSEEAAREACKPVPLDIADLKVNKYLES